MNLVTFKREHGIKYEKLYYFGGSLKYLTFRGKGGSRKTNIEGGRGCLNYQNFTIQT